MDAQTELIEALEALLEDRKRMFPEAHPYSPIPTAPSLQPHPLVRLRRGHSCQSRSRQSQKFLQPAMTPPTITLDKLLTPKLKDYYTKEFEKALRCQDPYWAIAPQIRENLIAINKNPDIQTLDSGFYLNRPEGRFSYLNYTFSEKEGPAQKKFLRNFQDFHKSVLSRTPQGIQVGSLMEVQSRREYRSPNPPKKAIEATTKNKIDLDMICNAPKYRNVDIITLNFIHPLQTLHMEFWDLVTLNLTPKTQMESHAP